MLEHPFLPWQEWLAIHAGELLEDGRPRFRIVLIIVARQNGKTEIPVVLSLYWQFVEAVPLILGTSTKLDYAKESWTKATKLAEKVRARNTPEAELFAELMGKRRWKRETNGEQESWTIEDSRYKIAAANEEGGRSLTIHRLICDELRQHKTYAAWGAAEPGCSPFDAQIFAMSNAGDATSVVLNDLREAALHFIQTGEGDPRLGIFEWSAEPGSDPTDIEALRQANPGGGLVKDLDVLLNKGRLAKRKGGDLLATFQTEDMCITVANLSPAINASAWADCGIPGTLDSVRDRIALCVDVSRDSEHATLAAAGVQADGVARVELLASWSGPGCTAELRRDLPAWIDRVNPRAVGWLPNGPAAALAAVLKDRPGRHDWPPPGVSIAEITGEVYAVCMGLSDLVDARQLAHSDDPLLTDHATTAERLFTGRRWSFTAPPGKHVDAVYAAAGAVHLARTMPVPIDNTRGMVQLEDD